MRSSGARVLAIALVGLASAGGLALRDAEAPSRDVLSLGVVRAVDVVAVAVLAAQLATAEGLASARAVLFFSGRPALRGYATSGFVIFGRPEDD